jgi:hypothetical protein
MHQSIRQIRLLFHVGVVLFTLALVFQLSNSSVSAQSDDTFAAVRSALQEKFGVDLRLVASYNWSQSEFPNGIETCLNEENRTGLSANWGIRYVITALNGNVYEGRVSGSTVVACDNVTQNEAAAPAAAPSDGNPAPVVSGNAAVGGFELGGHVLEMNPNTISLLQRSGMTWVKKQIRYNRGDDPSGIAWIQQQASANGFRVLVGVVGDPGQLAADFDGYLVDYSNYLAGVASLGFNAIEVWNEPNIDREWPAGQINGANYTRMLVSAYNAIKAANPNTIVISGAPAPTGFFGAAGCGAGGCNDDVFMQQMAAAGAAQYMDCVGLHYNEGIISPNQNGGDPRGSYPSYYFSSMLQRGYGPFGGKPVCFTELGYLSGQGYDLPIPANFAWANNTTVEQHATWLAEAAVIAANSGKVRLMIVWNVDFPFYTANDPMGGYAMFRPDGSCPACDTLGQVMR